MGFFSFFEDAWNSVVDNVGNFGKKLVGGMNDIEQGIKNKDITQVGHGVSDVGSAVGEIPVIGTPINVAEGILHTGQAIVEGDVKGTLGGIIETAAATSTEVAIGKAGYDLTHPEDDKKE